MDELIEFINGKSIALIGNATSLFNFDWRDPIKGHDIVWRLNRGVMMNYTYLKRVTRRCDVYTCGGRVGSIEHKNYWTTEYPKYQIYAPAWGDGGLTNPTKRGFNLFLPESFRESLIERLNEKEQLVFPSTGMLTTEFVLSTNFSSLTLFGFDFFKTKTYYRRLPSHAASHSPEKEQQYFEGLMSQDSRVMLALDRFPDAKAILFESSRL
jgi:hypothetical protein